MCPRGLGFACGRRASNLSYCNDSEAAQRNGLNHKAVKRFLHVTENAHRGHEIVRASASEHLRVDVGHGLGRGANGRRFRHQRGARLYVGHEALPLQHVHL